MKKTALFTIGCLAALTATAQAAPADYMKRSQAAAMSGELPTTAPELERVAGPSGAAVEAAMLASLRSKPTATVLVPDQATRRVGVDEIVYEGVASRLAISTDGVSFSYARKSLRPDAATRAIPEAELDVMGRKAITERLGGVINLASDEKLVLVDVRTRTFDLTDLKARTTRTFVEGTVGVFAIEKAGVLIVSNSVEVVFRGHDELIGWKAHVEHYKPSGRTINLVDGAHLRTRIAAGAIDINTPATGELLKGVYCGYMTTDASANAKLEPMCLVQYVGKPGDRGTMTLIPAAIAPAINPAVPMARYIQARGEPTSRQAYQRFVDAN